MTLPRRRLLQLTAAGLALPALPRIARAQAYPSRPITMIIAYTAGGPTDGRRVVAERMRRAPVVLENVGGAGGASGSARRPRGAGSYTINVGNWAPSSTARSAAYDLRPISSRSLLAQAPQMSGRQKATPADDLKSFIAWLKANPGRPADRRISPRASAACCSGDRHGLDLRALSRRVAGDRTWPGQIDMVIRRHRGNAAGAPAPSRLCGGCATRPARGGETPTRPACPAFMSRPGMRCSRRRARRRPSSTGSTPPRLRRSPIRRCARASPRSARKSRRASSRRRRRSVRSTRRTSRSGGRS